MAGPRRYHRVASAFWSDPTVMRWSDDARLLALYLLTCPHRASEGLFRLPRAYAADDLGWTAERLAEPFAELLADGFLEYDDETSTCLIVGALEANAPENRNQVTNCVARIRELPDSPLIPRFYALAERFSERLAKGLREGLPERLAEGFGKPQALTQAQTQSPPPSQNGGREGDVEFDIDKLERPGSRLR